MNKINFPVQKSTLKPLKDYPTGQVFILKLVGCGQKYLVQKTRCSSTLETLINLQNGERYFHTLEDAENRIFVDMAYNITPVDVEINIL